MTESKIISIMRMWGLFELAYVCRWKNSFYTNVYF